MYIAKQGILDNNYLVGVFMNNRKQFRFSTSGNPLMNELDFCIIFLRLALD